MRTVALSTLRKFWSEGHADAESSLRAWFKIADAASWRRYADVRAEFPSADQVRDKLIFNICGNKYRLIVKVNFEFGSLYVKWIGTHAEYDRLSEKEIKGL